VSGSITRRAPGSSFQNSGGVSGAGAIPQPRSLRGLYVKALAAITPLFRGSEGGSK
jgi:hypothetical protein